MGFTTPTTTETYYINTGNRPRQQQQQQQRVATHLTPEATTTTTHPMRSNIFISGTILQIEVRLGAWSVSQFVAIVVALGSVAVGGVHGPWSYNFRLSLVTSLAACRRTDNCAKSLARSSADRQLCQITGTQIDGQRGTSAP